MSGDESIVIAEARAIASLMPALARGLFALDHDPAGDLPLAQLRVCGILEEGPKPMSALSRELGVSLSAMTQIADRLERAGLVKRVAEGNDRRVRCLQLTPRGERMFRARKKARIAYVSAVLGHLSAKEREDVLAMLETLLRACNARKGQDGGPGGSPSPASQLAVTASKASL